MKKCLVTLFVIGLALSLWGNAISLGRANTTITLTSSGTDGISVEYGISDLQLSTVNTVRGDYTLLTADGLSFTNEVGQPKLPVSRKIISVPLNATVVPTVVSSTTEEYDLTQYGAMAPIIPAQASLAKNIRPEDAPFVVNDNAYRTSGYDRAEAVSVEELGIMRGLRVFLLTVRPISYDPTTNHILVMKNLQVRVDFQGGDLVATNHMRLRTFSPYFESVYAQSVLNYAPVNTRDVITRYPTKYVIVSPRMFEDTLQPFVEWKTKQGFEVIEAYTDDPNVGTTTTSIHNYLQNLYDEGTEEDPAPSYVLIVGDTGQIPAWSGSTGTHVTDLNYVKCAGNDFIPEMYYGRFSATSVAELQPQVDKTLEYEMYTMPDPSYLGNCDMIAGVDDSHGSVWANGQINYGTTYYFNTEHGLDSNTYLYPSSGSAATQIHQDVSNGVCYANYTAHGSPDGWYNPEFSVSDVAALTNADKYPLMVGNCCQTNAFDTSVCFGEALLRAANKGAIGYIGCTDYSYWDEDYYWGVGSGSIVANPTYETHGEGAYDGMFHDLGEAHSDWFVTTDAMIYCGDLAVTEGGGNYTYYWETYSIMGDPSLMPYMGVPVENTAVYDAQLLLGVTTYQVVADPYSTVAITANGEIHAFGVTDANGQLTLNVAPFEEPTTASLVICAQNRQPIITTLDVLPNDGPYVVSHVTQTADGDDNVPSYGDNITLTVAFENVGADPASNLTATLSVDDDYITITDGTANYTSIASGQTITDTPFTFTIAANVPDQHQVQLDISVTDGTDTWVSHYNMTIIAPILTLSQATIDDQTGGNDNGRLDPGETVNMVLPLNNSGSMETEPMTVNLTCVNPWISIPTTTMQLVALGAGQVTAPEFSVTVNSNFPAGTVVPFVAEITAGSIVIQQTFNFTLGMEVDDFESGSFSPSYDWAMGGNAAWTVVANQGYNGSTHSAKSGSISANQNSNLSVGMTVEVAQNISFARKVSSEANGDYLRFYIDNELQGEWSGTLDWEMESFPVTTGYHTFYWKYMKNGTTTSGSDCAWIDDVAFPMPAAEPVAICSPSTDTMAFGGVDLYHTAQIPLTVTNYGTTDLTGTFRTIDCFTVQVGTSTRTNERRDGSRDLDFTIPAGESANFIVVFEPTQSITYSGNITIVSNDIAFPTRTIAVTGSGTTDVNDGQQNAFTTKLQGNYPNPFNPTTLISFSLAESTPVTLNVYNLRGEKVRTLVANEMLSAGVHNVTWNGTNDSNQTVGSGVYFYEMRGGKYTAVKKMILLK